LVIPAKAGIHCLAVGSVVAAGGLAFGLSGFQASLSVLII